MAGLLVVEGLIVAFVDEILFPPGTILSVLAMELIFLSILAGPSWTFVTTGTSFLSSLLAGPILVFVTDAFGLLLTTVFGSRTRGIPEETVLSTPGLSLAVILVGSVSGFAFLPYPEISVLRVLLLTLVAIFDHGP